MIKVFEIIETVRSVIFTDRCYFAFADAEWLHIGGKTKRILPVQLHIVRQTAATLYFSFDLKADGQDKILNLTGCRPNHPREDLASFLRLAQAVRGFFFEVRSLI